MAIFSEYVLREALKKIYHGLPAAENSVFFEFYKFHLLDLSVKKHPSL